MVFREDELERDESMLIDGGLHGAELLKQGRLRTIGMDRRGGSDKITAENVTLSGGSKGRALAHVKADFVAQGRRGRAPEIGARQRNWNARLASFQESSALHPARKPLPN